MVSWVEQLEARGRPTTVVPLPGPAGTIDVELRALPPQEWEALCALHPGQEPGTVDAVGMIPDLLAAVVVAEEDSPARDPAWWQRQAKDGVLGGEELAVLAEAARGLHQRDLPVSLGKDSGPTPS